MGDEESATIASRAISAALDERWDAEGVAAATGLPVEDARGALAVLMAANPCKVTASGGEISVVFRACEVPTVSPWLDLAKRWGLNIGALLVFGTTFFAITSGLFGLGNWLLAATFPGATVLGWVFYVLGGAGLVVFGTAFALAIGPVWMIWTLLHMGWEAVTGFVVYAVVFAMVAAVSAKFWGWFRRFIDWSVDVTIGHSSADRLGNERRLMGLLRRNRGVVGLTDLMRAFTWTSAQAYRQVTRILVDYEGDVVVTDDGAILYVFPKFEAKKARKARTHRPSPRRRLMGRIGYFVLTVLGFVSVAFSPNMAGLFPGPAALAKYDWTTVPGLSALVLQSGAISWLYLVVFGTYVAHGVQWLRSRRNAERTAKLRAVLAVAAKHPDGTWMKDADVETLAEIGGSVDEEAGLHPDGSVRVVFEDFALERAARKQYSAA